MSLIAIRKRSLTIETALREGGPGGRPSMPALRSLGRLLAQELVGTLARTRSRSTARPPSWA